MRRYLLLVLSVLLCAAVQAQTTIYVSSVVTDDSDNGSSWGHAKKYISSGIAALNGNPGTVFVMAGEYNITAELQIPAGTIVLGGYSQNSIGTDTSMRNLPGVNSHWQDNTYCSIIKGDGTFRIATVGGLLDGCVLRNGFSSTMGGGVLIDAGTVSHCVLMGCDAIADEDASAEGGGAYIRNNGTLTNCVVTECRGDNGSAVSGEDGILINNTITRNWPSQCGTVKDYEGNTYHTVRLGNQCWMRENLRTTHYADGTALTTSSGTSTTTPYYYYSYHDNNEQERYGLLYNWPAVMNGAESSNANPSGVQGICPNGWHVPSRAEWEELIDFVTSIPNYRCGTGSGSIAKALSSRVGWNWSSSSCCPGNYQENNNASRFSAVPSGTRYGSSFYDGAYYSVMWSATSSSNWYSYRFYISNSNAGIHLETYSKEYGYAVRCIKDEE
ncbi:MAG: fibrobacter succinogenes major paralogous domain-containing protein [Bacteroidales bacterium]|nr:fibrobacter succinogenes major paralogous domain-containing protein [Bacteroidales bacterium]